MIPYAIIILTGLIALAIATDLNARKIPNVLTGFGLLCGLLLSTAGFNGSIGWSGSLLGAVTGLLLFLPMHMLGKMGAGDVKLLSMVGSFLGVEAIFIAGLCALVAGGILAILWVGLCQHQGRINTNVNNIDSAGSGVAGNGASLTRTNFLQQLVKDQRYPYAPAIALGVYLGSFIPVS